MTSKDMLDRISKNEIKLEKKEALLKKKLSKIDFEIDLTLTRREFIQKYKTLYDNRWFEIDGIKDTYEQIKDIKLLIEKQKEQLNKQQIKEDKLTSIPQVLIDFREYLINTWNEYDFNKQKFYNSEYKKLGFDVFLDTYKYTSYNFMHLKKEEVIKNNTRDAERLIINLLDRVEEKVGYIEDCSNLYVTSDNGGFSVINGIIKGNKGTARVESIGAGGYNIQKYHIRVLVK